MIYNYILAIDPSGNFEEGKGTTGTCLFNVTMNCIEHIQDIKASDYKTKEEYWQAHINFIKQIKNEYGELCVIIEDFTLDPRRAMQQSHSKMETPKIIGILQLYCKQKGLPYKMQRAVEVKNRWADHILEYKKYIVKKNRMYYPGNALLAGDKPISRHCKDAIRHAVHYHTFYNKEEK